MDVNLDLRTQDGRPATALAQIIELRRQELGETTRQACVAMAIGILRSIRAGTTVAKTKGDIKVTCVDSMYTPSFRRERGSQGKNVSSRVLRAGKNGPVVTPAKVVWRTGKYVRGEDVHTYQVIDKIGPSKTYEYLLVISGGQSAAMREAKQRHKRRVLRNRGLAKLAVGLAMHAVSTRESPSAGNVSNSARRIAAKVVRASVTDNGFSSGQVNVHVEDNLDYAALALKNG